jgi:hypothetical protein
VTNNQAFSSLMDNMEVKNLLWVFAEVPWVKLKEKEERKNRR